MSAEVIHSTPIEVRSVPTGLTQYDWSFVLTLENGVQLTYSGRLARIKTRVFREVTTFRNKLIEKGVDHEQYDSTAVHTS